MVYAECVRVRDICKKLYLQIKIGIYKSKSGFTNPECCIQNSFEIFFSCTKTYYCTRMSVWGDRLPIKIDNVEESGGLTSNEEEGQSEECNAKVEESQESNHKMGK